MKKKREYTESITDEIIKTEQAKQKEQDDLRYCRYCGNKIKKDDKFCPHCSKRQIMANHVEEEKGTLGILSIIIASLWGWLSIVFGVWGMVLGCLGFILAVVCLCLYKDDRNRKNCKITFIIYACWIIGWILYQLICNAVLK